MLDGTKCCPRCETVKSTEEFGRNRRNKDGLMSHCKKCHAARTLAYYNSTGKNEDRRYSRHGISRAQFDKTLELQGNVCPICLTVGEKMVVDHDHSHCGGTFGCAECFRGVLCGKCNRGLGVFRDSTEVLQRALDYLSRQLEFQGVVA